MYTQTSNVCTVTGRGRRQLEAGRRLAAEDDVAPWGADVGLIYIGGSKREISAHSGAEMVCVHAVWRLYATCRDTAAQAQPGRVTVHGVGAVRPWWCPRLRPCPSFSARREIIAAGMSLGTWVGLVRPVPVLAIVG